MRIRNLLEIVLLGMMWGPSFLFIKVAVGSLSPMTLVAGRVGLAALFLYTICRMKGRALPKAPGIWLRLGIAGFFASSLPFILFALAELRISSMMAGIINGSTPLFTALFAHFFLPSDRLTLRRTMGVLVGALGFALLLLPTLASQGLHGDTLGVLAVGVASISYAVSFIYVKKYVPSLPPLVAPTGMLVISAAYLVPLAMVAEPLGFASIWTWQAVGSVVGLAFFGTACAYTLYYRVLAHSGPVSLSMALYLMTFFSVLLGRIVLDETLSWVAYLAGALVLVGMALVNGGFRFRRLALEKNRLRLKGSRNRRDYDR